MSEGAPVSHDEEAAEEAAAEEAAAEEAAAEEAAAEAAAAEAAAAEAAAAEAAAMAAAFQIALEAGDLEALLILADLGGDGQNGESTDAGEPYNPYEAF
ncbi:MAG: hypothetical protein ACOZAN_04615 [Patescibacteria group bacterium]